MDEWPVPSVLQISLVLDFHMEGSGNLKATHFKLQRTYTPIRVLLVLQLYQSCSLHLPRPQSSCRKDLCKPSYPPPRIGSRHGGCGGSRRRRGMDCMELELSSRKGRQWTGGHFVHGLCRQSGQIRPQQDHPAASGRTRCHSWRPVAC